MKKFFLKLLIFTIILSALLYGYDRIAITVENPQVKKMIENFKYVPTASYISFGNSQGKRVKLGYNNQKDFANLCLNGNDILSIAEQVKVVAPKLKPAQTIIINLSYYSLKY